MNRQDNQNNQRDECRREDTQDNRQAATVRRNPRLVVGGLDYFDLLMEQDEQK